LIHSGVSPWRWRQQGPPKCWYPTATQPRRPRLGFLYTYLFTVPEPWYSYCLWLPLWY